MINIPSDVVKNFSKLVNTGPKTTEKPKTFVYGTIVENDGNLYLQLDGSDELAEPDTVTQYAEGDRVVCTIEDHHAVIMGNYTDPALNETGAEEMGLKKEATNYLSSDDTGIMVADLADGQETPRTATGRNVKIDNDSVDIRDGRDVLASFGEVTTVGDASGRHIEIDEAGFETKLNGTDELIFIGIINDPENNDYAEILERTQVIEIRIVDEGEGEEFVGLYLNTPCVQLLDVKYGNTSILNLVTMYDDRTVKFTSSGSTYLYEYVTVSYYTDDLVPCLRFGENNTCKSKYAVVFGTRNEVYAKYALATGYGCKIYGPYSVAEGYESSAIGMASHAEGFQSHATGYYAHAEGYSNDANGGASHAEGDNTEANGLYSHSEGHNTLANGQCSHASGEGTIARGSHQTVIGKYNVEDLLDRYAFIIGNGSGTGNRSNALAVKWDGTPISPAISYGINDTFSVTQLNISGVMAVTNTTVILSLETDKYMDQVSTVTVTSLVGALRGVNGYIDGSRYDTNWITSAYTVTATKKSRKHVEIRITKANSGTFTNATTDTPVSLYATMTLTFST